MEFGRCTCGGSYEPRLVEITTVVRDEPVVVDVPQGVCSLCGSCVYSAQVLVSLERLLKGA